MRPASRNQASTDIRGQRAQGQSGVGRAVITVQAKVSSRGWTSSPCFAVLCPPLAPSLAHPVSPSRQLLGSGRPTLWLTALASRVSQPWLSSGWSGKLFIPARASVADSISVSQSMSLRSPASKSMVILCVLFCFLGPGHILGPLPESLNHTLWVWEPRTTVLTRSPSGSETHLLRSEFDFFGPKEASQKSLSNTRRKTFFIILFRNSYRYLPSNFYVSDTVWGMDHLRDKGTCPHGACFLVCGSRGNRPAISKYKNRWVTAC